MNQKRLYSYYTQTTTDIITTISTKIASFYHINNNSFQYLLANAMEGDGEGCTSGFIYFQKRQIYKTWSMIEADEFREKSRWVLNAPTLSFPLSSSPLAPKAHGLQTERFMFSFQ